MRLLEKAQGMLIVAATCICVVGWLMAKGGSIFSPGELSVKTGASRAGGFQAHADLSQNCSACHAPPWSRETLADRCLNCHADVRKQLDSRGPLHGKLSNGRECRLCHTEHQGPHGRLTHFDRFDHAATAFPLTGKHTTVACQQCHTNSVFKGTAQNCSSCHQEPAIHQGKFGLACAECHSTATWKGATFKHTFPLNHGLKGGKKKKDQPLLATVGTSTCITCHSTPGHYHTYTCYGCHAHTPEKTARQHRERKEILRGQIALEQCVKCHPTGRGHERRADAPFSSPAFCQAFEESTTADVLLRRLLLAE